MTIMLLFDLFIFYLTKYPEWTASFHELVQQTLNVPSFCLALAFGVPFFFFFPGFLSCCTMQNVRLAKVALRPGAGNMVNAILRKLVLLKVCHFKLI